LSIVGKNFFLALSFALALAWPRNAVAHTPTFMMYSKFEATTNGKSIAFVFGLDQAAALQLIERDVTHAKVDPSTAPNYRDYFSTFIFERFFVLNGGTSCSHPDKLERVLWDEPYKRIVAVTKFTCPTDLADLTIRSYVTRDTPPSHELVGDLLHGRALVRNVFYGDDSDSAQAQYALPSLPQTGESIPTRVVRHRGQFSYVPMPTRERQYEDLTRAAFGGDGPAHEVNGRRPAGMLAHFTGQGILHIFTGYDHVLFIVTLMLVVGSWRHLAMIVTSFTAAHSLTLVLATLGLVTLPGRVVEPLIALSVLFVAVDAVVRPEAGARVPVAFGFGLVHGLGLSSALRALGLSGRELVPALVGFNVGVEIGQLLIVGPLFAMVLVLRRKETAYARVRNVICSSVAVVAVFWIVMRLREAF
jgi:hydrogenase/urease accessory protein HupE